MLLVNIYTLISIFQFCQICDRTCTLVSIFHYTEYAGLNIAVILYIASQFSHQIAIVNAGPSLALESMGAKRSFRCHLFNIAPIYKQ